MGRISVIITDELEKDFRHKVVEKFGGRRGDISKGLTESLRMWINQDSIPTNLEDNHDK